MPAMEGTPNVPPNGSGTLELLLDVELPVRVSFGKAQMPLQQVLKWTTGSIVELESAVNESVEVVVNNCVIARGEVVVVDGNYGVRIQQIVSRAERIETSTGPAEEK
jgi:flagellar motor switch protein FliN/FliY